MMGRVEVGDAFLVMPPIQVVSIYLRVQFTQQVAFAIFAGAGLFKGGCDSAILPIFGEVGQSHLELDPDKVRKLAPVGVVHLYRVVRLVGLPSQRDLGC